MKKAFTICILLLQSMGFCSPDEFFQRENSCISENSLLKYARTIYSQAGEEGVLEEILNRIGVKQGFFIEFGACDGIILSNTKFLFDQGWKGVFIENNQKYFDQLVANYKNQNRILCLKELVVFDNNDSRGKTLDQIADYYFPEQEIDVLSIDVDSWDFLIFENLQRKPKIICVEGGFCWSPLFNTRIPYEIAIQTYVGQPPAVMHQIGKDQGYTLVCIIGCNYIFVINDLSSSFSETSKNLLTLWNDYWHDLGTRAPNTQEWISAYRANTQIFREFEGELFMEFPITERYSTFNLK